MENIAIDSEKEYPDKFEFDVKFEARIQKQEDGGYCVFIPACNAFFSAKTEEDIKRRGGAMVKSTIRFWQEEEGKGTFKGVWDKK